MMIRSEKLGTSIVPSKPFDVKSIFRFWSKVDIKDDPNACWPWLRTKAWGYGIFWHGGRMLRAHRVALFLSTGVWGEVARHSCDFPTCCNPKHLNWGSQSENALDSVAKGRWVNNKGSANGRAKLTEEQVSEIKKRLAKGEKQSVIARFFGVSASRITFIKKGQQWRHVK